MNVLFIENMNLKWKKVYILIKGTVHHSMELILVHDKQNSVLPL